MRSIRVQYLAKWFQRHDCIRAVFFTSDLCAPCQLIEPVVHHVFAELDGVVKGAVCDLSGIGPDEIRILDDLLGGRIATPMILASNPATGDGRTLGGNVPIEVVRAFLTRW